MGTCHDASVPSLPRSPSAAAVTAAAASEAMGKVVLECITGRSSLAGAGGGGHLAGCWHTTAGRYVRGLLGLATRAIGWSVVGGDRVTRQSGTGHGLGLKVKLVGDDEMGALGLLV